MRFLKRDYFQVRIITKQKSPNRERKCKKHAPRWAAGGRVSPGLSVPCALRRPAALYCMNEAELVEVALAVLAEARSRSEEEQELPPTPKEAPGSTAGSDGGGGRGPALPSPPGAGAVAERTGGEDSEDDALKYVREIFFS
uniref:Cell cycle regulator of NHEJ n=1 Tax=Ficedula albicollis TaxID=59894 RepID=A0A803V7G7_FICAL